MEQDRKAWIYDRVPMVEEDMGTPTREHFLALDQLTSPRIFATHLPASYFREPLLRTSCKIILLLRNPKDQLVSQFHFLQQSKVIGQFTGSWDDFFKFKVQQQKLRCGDYMESITGWWELLQDRDDALIIKYEDMKKDPVVGIGHLAAFLGVTITAKTLANIAEYTSFSNMKKKDVLGEAQSERPMVDMRDDSVSLFLRKATVGDWRRSFTAEQNEYIDEIYKAWLDKTGIDFDFGIPS